MLQHGNHGIPNWWGWCSPLRRISLPIHCFSLSRSSNSKLRTRTSYKCKNEERTCCIWVIKKKRKQRPSVPPFTSAYKLYFPFQHPNIPISPKDGSSAMAASRSLGRLLSKSQKTCHGSVVSPRAAASATSRASTALRRRSRCAGPRGPRRRWTPPGQWPRCVAWHGTVGMVGNLRLLQEDPQVDY